MEKTDAMKDKLRGYYTDVPVSKNWNDLQEKFNKYCNKGTWVFRGQPEGNLGLTTVLDRFFEALENKNNHELEPENKKSLELGLLRKFMRQYYQFEEEVTPDEQDMPTWLSLMRHYGAPTRFLDWTWSFNVATFFAVEKLDSHDIKVPCEVWAANITWLEDKRLFASDMFPRMKSIFHGKDRNLRRLDSFSKFLKKSAVICLTPYHLNKRLTIQQGIFLMSCNITKDFSANLIALAGREKKKLKDNLIRFKIENTISTKGQIMKVLHRMNMSRAVLYPGLDGFAKSLGNFLIFMPDILIPEKKLYTKFYPSKNKK